MQLNHRRFQLGIFGGSGSGKTTFAMKFVAWAPSQCVFLFDPEGEFADTLRVPPARTHWELDAAVRSGWCCFDPHTLYPGELEDALDYFGRYALACARRIPGRKFIVFDEAGRYMSGNVVPRPLKIIAQAGRRYGLDGVWIGQQPNELHNTIRCQLSEVVCFQLTDDCALEFPAKYGFDPEELRRLPPYRFVCRTNQGALVRG